MLRDILARTSKAIGGGSSGALATATTTAGIIAMPAGLNPLWYIAAGVAGIVANAAIGYAVTYVFPKNAE